MKEKASSPFDLSGAVDKPLNRFEVLIGDARKHDAWLQTIIARDGALRSTGCIEFKTVSKEK
jgi:hypothetical protein